MSGWWRNPLPMGTAAAAGATTDATKLQMAQAYGSRGGRKSAAKRRKAKGTKKRRRSSAPKQTRRRSGPAFGTPAWRKKYGLGKKKRARRK